MKINFFIILLLCVSSFSSCKVKEIKKETLNEQAQNYIADYNELVDTLTTYHPALYEFTSKSDFDKKVEQLRNEIDNTTAKRELLWKLNEIIALAGDVHSSFGFFGSYSNLIDYKEYFPLQARLIKNQFIVIDPMVNKNIINKGDIIESINGTPISQVIDEAYRHIQSQFHIRNGKKGLFNAFQDNYIPYSLNFPKSYQVKIKGEEKPVELKPIVEKPKYPSIISPNSPCQKQLCLNELNSKTALLTLRSFAYYGDKMEIFKDFLDDSFKEIKEKKYQNLIIDVRGNLGGTSETARHLLKHTLSEPFKFFSQSDFGNTDFIKSFDKNFKGRIFVLINGDGFSSVGQLASIYKDKNRVIFVGETLGSNQFCTANQKQFELTNTKFNYTVARNIFITDVQEKDPKATIQPNIEIEQSIDDFLSNKDVVLEKAIELTEK